MRLVHSTKKELLYISLLMLVFVISEIIINPKRFVLYKTDTVFI